MRKFVLLCSIVSFTSGVIFLLSHTDMAFRNIFSINIENMFEVMFGIILIILSVFLLIFDRRINLFTKILLGVAGVFGTIYLNNSQIIGGILAIIAGFLLYMSYHRLLLLDRKIKNG